MDARIEAVLPFVLAQVRAGVDVRALYAAADRDGHDLAAVLDVLLDPHMYVAQELAEDIDHTTYRRTGVLFELVEHAGLRRGSTIVARSENARGLDLAAHHAGTLARIAAEDAITQREPLQEAYARITDPRLIDAERTWLLDRVAMVYPLDEVIAFAITLPEHHARAIGDRLRRTPAALPAPGVLIAEMSHEDALAVLDRIYGVPRPDGDPRSAVLRAYVALARAAFQTLDGPLRFARAHGEPAWWVPILRELGLQASHAALALLEAGYDRMEVARIIADTGYSDDDVLAALLENGIGTRTSLALLRDGDWSVSRMVAALHARGALLPEIRGQLDELGVSREAQRGIVRAHFTVDLVDLVLADEASGESVKRLHSGD
ncbi:MAG: hypothetical protein AB7S26_24975 [Sandaracinaceae bacterium]